MKNIRTYVAGVGYQFWEELRDLLDSRSSIFNRVAPLLSALKDFNKRSSNTIAFASTAITEKDIPEINSFISLLQDSPLINKFSSTLFIKKLEIIRTKPFTAIFCTLPQIYLQFMKMSLRKNHHKIFVFRSD
jgi:hypothetical protein